VVASPFVADRLHCITHELSAMSDPASFKLISELVQAGTDMF
jgi:hypothetical protein